MNNQVKHELKILPEYFQAVWNRTKTFEVRKNDRNYAVGDELFLREWAPDTGYTGSGLVRRVSYILEDSEYVKEGFVILGLADPVPIIKPGDKVRHSKYGYGDVKKISAWVWFLDGPEYKSIPPKDLEVVE